MRAPTSRLCLLVPKETNTKATTNDRVPKALCRKFPTILKDNQHAQTCTHANLDVRVLNKRVKPL